MNALATTIGLAAQVLGTVCWIPQVAKTWRTRSADDLSRPSLALVATAVAAFGVSFALDGAHLLALGQIPTLGLILALLAMKTRFRPACAVGHPDDGPVSASHPRSWRKTT